MHGLVLVIAVLAIACSALFHPNFRRAEALSATAESSQAAAAASGEAQAAAPEAAVKSAVQAPNPEPTLPAELQGFSPDTVSVIRASSVKETPAPANPSATPSQEPRTAAAAPEATPTPTAEPTKAAEPFVLYKVVEGDTVSGIANRFGVKTQYVIWNNVDLPDEDSLALGQTIVVPSEDGIVHHVRYGETLTDIADRYGVELDEITSSKYNSLLSPDTIAEAQVVFVPNGEVAPPPPPPTATPTAAPQPTSEPGARPTSNPSPSSGLIWPISGPISSYYGPSHPLGIDIDLYNNPSGAIAASHSGTVIFAGGNSGYSYGLYVIVRGTVNGQTYETLYAHLSSLAVSQGETVGQGELLGNGGCTGYCTGNHLHFELIINGARRNPLDYLP